MGTKMATTDHVERIWSIHKNVHSLSFDKEHETSRFGNFKDNHLFIHDHNKSTKHHLCGHNKFSHWGFDEYKKQLTLKKSNDVPQTQKLQATEQYLFDGTVDWEQQGYVTPVKNQGQCGSCWAFGTVATMESAHAIQTNNLVSMSEQQLIDFDTYNNNGCNGGLPYWAFYYLQTYGLVTEQEYPYYGGQEHQIISVEGNYGVGQIIQDGIHNAVEFQTIIKNNGPSSVGIYAASRSMMMYKSGVYYDSSIPYNCEVDHCVTVVGYGEMNGQKFYKIKNSWGTTWGDNGYLYLLRDVQGYLGILEYPCSGTYKYISNTSSN